MKSSKKSFLRQARVRLLVSATVILLAASTLLLYSFCKRAVDKNSVIMQMVVRLADQGHVSPPELDDLFSEKVFAVYLKKLDAYKWFLTAEDIRMMEPHKKRIDDQIKNSSFELFNLSTQIIDRKIPEVQGYYREILASPLDLNTSETWEADPDKRPWPANSAELKEYWRKDLQMRVLTHVANALKAQEKETDTAKIKTLAAIEADARQKLLKSYNDMFMNNLVQQKAEGKFSLYMNAIMTVFDPHSSYNTPKDKEEFDRRMSGQFEGIGAQLTPSDGYAKVMMLVPGSPSWLQGELKVNDLITKVKQENEAEPVDIFGMSLDDAVNLIRGKKGTKVTLSVKRVDGSVHDITITRAVVIEEETYAKSAILTDPKTKIRAGYIDLPSFYGDLRGNRTASTDVAKEIEKLKQEGVEGIILDLRFNTGGLLFDAVKLAGLFIKSGPIVQVKQSVGLPRVHSDPDPNLQHGGPLIILVNAISASASEIVSAALQDYGRAVIIGTQGTFGKGTVQKVVELDYVLPASISSLKPTGSLHLTIEKYYRINGGSVQLKGVTADILLPDPYSEMKFGERYEENALPWTTVSKQKFEAWNTPLDLNTLRGKSRKRTDGSESFKLMNEQVAQMRKQRDSTQVSLNLQTYRRREEKQKAENQRFEEISKLPTSITVAAPAADVAAMKGDTVKTSRSNKWIKDLNRDIFLEEAVKVIGDMK